MSFQNLTPMLGVSSIRNTITFYEKLGFKVNSTFGEGSEPCWVHMEAGKAQLMFYQLESDCKERSAAKDDMIFYLYPEVDVVTCQQQLKTAGLSVSDLRVTVYQMKEFELRDPDNYAIWYGQETDEPPTVPEE